MERNRERKERGRKRWESVGEEIKEGRRERVKEKSRGLTKKDERKVRRTYKKEQDRECKQTVQCWNIYTQVYTSSARRRLHSCLDERGGRL
jgi:hypothetical protein